LRVYSNSTSTLGINVLAVTDNSWVEKSVTYDNAPLVGDVLGYSGPITTGTWIEIDVTPYVTGEGIYDCGINTTSGTALSLASRETGANAPQLIIDLQ
jgi:hypothetical protein